jgi:hypothetical protein
MDINNEIEQLFFDSPLARKFKEFNKTMSHMRCSVHGNNADFKVGYMYISFMDSHQIKFNTTDRCCCKKFEIELSDKAVEFLKGKCSL